MIALPADHPLRLPLADEVHARPFEPVPTPSRLTYVALLVDGEHRDQERAHLARLLARFDQPAPDGQATQLRLTLGTLRLKWERHGEFSGYTVIAPGADPAAPFDRTAGEQLPADWLQSLPGRTVVAAHATLLPAPPDASEHPPYVSDIAPHFGGHTIVGARIGEGVGFAYTDFRVHGDGCSRFLVYDAGFNPFQAGRMIQRLFEIEAYRMLALLALPIARRQSPRIVAIEKSLAELTDGIAREDGREEALLHELTRLAAEVESGLAASQFRFGACRAYSELVQTRIHELRETRLPGLQTIEEFMARRFTPAVSTCNTISQRLHDLSDRVAQASSLLATRVGIAREHQNQQLLASMDRRAKLQLRLQQTVEGLSVAAILYYLVGLVGYAAKALGKGGLPVEPDIVAGLSVPVLGAIVFLALRRTRKRLQGEA
jgi:uncharacterized membrane-anchored protein